MPCCRAPHTGSIDSSRLRSRTVPAHSEWRGPALGTVFGEPIRDQRQAAFVCSAENQQFSLWAAAADFTANFIANSLSNSPFPVKVTVKAGSDLSSPLILAIVSNPNA